MSVNVLFVCLGNICRSPTAHGVFEALVAKQQLSDQIVVDSAGTGSWHVGNPPDERAQGAALSRGLDIGSLRARRVERNDFDHFDYILAMDRQNLDDLSLLKPDDFSGKLELFLRFADNPGTLEVPDPYYSAADGFDQVFELVEDASQGLLAHIRAKHL